MKFCHHLSFKKSWVASEVVGSNPFQVNKKFVKKIGKFQKFLIFLSNFTKFCAFKDFVSMIGFQKSTIFLYSLSSSEVMNYYLGYLMILPTVHCPGTTNI